MNTKIFNSLEDALTHFSLSNYDLSSLDNIFDRCQKHYEKVLQTLEVSTEDGSEYTTYSYEVPGVEKSDIEITLVDSKLSVKVSKKNGKEVNLSNIVSIPKTLDASKVSSKLDLGILKVKIWKSESLKPRTVKID